MAQMKERAFSQSVLIKQIKSKQSRSGGGVGRGRERGQNINPNEQPTTHYCSCEQHVLDIHIYKNITIWSVIEQLLPHKFIW
jgi:hypothetical protein